MKQKLVIHSNGETARYDWPATSVLSISIGEDEDGPCVVLSLSRPGVAGLLIECGAALVSVENE